MQQVDKLAALRAEMNKAGIQGFLIPRADEFLGEYVPERGERLAWATGFTGSAGLAVVLTGDKALVTTDSRYKIQVGQETDPALFDQKICGLAGVADWIIENAAKGSAIGYDPKLHTFHQIEDIEKNLTAKGVTLKPLDHNPLDAAWHDQPGMPMDKVENFPVAIAGLTAEEKRDMIATKINDAGATAAVLTAGDSIAWLLNIRGNDVPHTPFALSYAIVHSNGDVDWFIDPAKIPPDVHAHLGNRVQVHAPDRLDDGLKALAQKSISENKPVMLDPAHSPVWFKQVLESQSAKTLMTEDPCILPKACKTPQEQAAIRNAHLRDGVAVTKFLCWLDKHPDPSSLTELDIADKLLDFRKMDKGFRDTSFDTIAGWGANGAIVHYRATPEKHAQISTPGLLLLDSGAQYQEGTTDITRTISIGEPTQKMKDAFTRVLKGHIGVASIKFPKGTSGQTIDVLARQSLWADGKDYGHGTGHGVGCYLSVHEEGGGISAKSKRPFEEGMVVSNEPGYYEEGEFGIRIENLVMVRPTWDIGGRPGLCFETLTLAPIDRRLIVESLMTHEETAWLDQYHARVEREIGPHLDAGELAWLKEATKPLKKPSAAGPAVSGSRPPPAPRMSGP